MVSTLKLTKIQIPNSDSDVLSFNSSTGVMTFHKDIKGEGTATTNLQQGLAKAWANTSGSGTPVVDDSFNNASVTDNGTGDQTFVFTNNMNNANHSCNAMTLDNSQIVIVQLLGQSSSNVNPKSHTPSSSHDVTGKNYTVHGDLA